MIIRYSYIYSFCDRKIDFGANGDRFETSYLMDVL